MHWSYCNELGEVNTWKGTQWIRQLCERLPIFLLWSSQLLFMCQKHSYMSPWIQWIENQWAKCWRSKLYLSWEYLRLGKIKDGLLVKKINGAKLNSKSLTKLKIQVVQLKTTRKVLTVQTVLKLRRLRAWEERREPSSEKSCVQTSPAFGLQY